MDIETLVAPPAELARRFVADLDREIRAAAPDRPFTLAVPGGSVAREFFPELSRAALDRRPIDIFWVDERAVPPDSPDSNYALARSLWLEPAAVPASRVHPIYAEPDDLVRAAADYAKTLASLAGTPPVLDFVLLGVGDDGHVASLFPRDADLQVPRPGSVGWTLRAPKPPPARVTLTFETLRNARRVAIAAFGTSKAAAVASARAGADSPLGRLLREAKRPLLLLDEEAAGGR